jgi:hypothetical protein
MVIKFNQIKKKSILCCVVDNLDRYQSGWAREVSINLSDYLLYRMDKNNFDIFISKNENELLQEAAKEGYTHAVLIASGTSLKLSDRIFAEIENKCREEFFIAGHILDRSGNPYYKNSCFELHHQFYIVNLKEYQELGQPEIGNEIWESYSQLAPLRSEESQYGDHEIPLWLRQGTETKQYDMKLHGWNILNVGLENNKKLVDVGAGIRDNKKYMYFETDHVFVKMMAEVFHYEFFCTVFIAGWNSDSLVEDISFEGPVEQYVSVGTGLFWISNLEKIKYTPETKVIFTDINYNCLMFMKSLVEEWDGKDYPAFYKQRMSMLPSGTPDFTPQYLDKIQKDWIVFLERFDDWDSLWNSIKQLDFKFVPLDYMATHNYDWLERGKKTVMNLSDLYNHAPYIPIQSVKYRIACENRLINELTKIQPDIFLMMTSRAADGFWGDIDSTHMGIVSDYKLTDIDKLKIPPWHKTEWVTTHRPIGL